MIKNILILIFTSLLLFSCNSKNQVADNFEELKLGMTVEEFEKGINQKIILKPSERNSSLIASTVTKVKISNEIILDSLYIEVYKNQIILLQTKNESIYKSLIKNFKVNWRNDKAETIVETIETNNKNVVCEFLYKRDSKAQDVVITIFYLDKFNIGSS